MMIKRSLDVFFGAPIAGVAGGEFGWGVCPSFPTEIGGDVATGVAIGAAPGFC